MNKGQSQRTSRRSSLSKAFGNIRGRQDTPPHHPHPPVFILSAIMEAVAQDGGSFEAECDGTFLGFDGTFYCANQSLWAERKSLIKIYPNPRQDKAEEFKMVDLSRGGGAWKTGASVTDTFHGGETNLALKCESWVADVAAEVVPPGA